MKHRTLQTWFAIGHLANDWPIAALWLIVPAAGVAMELSPSEIGLLFTLFNIGGAIAYLPSGVLADHVSNRGRLLVVTFWWVALGYVLAALAPGFWSLALLLSIAGMGNAAWHPIATGVLTKENGERRAQALGVFAIGGSLAEVLAPLSVGFLLVHVDWRGTLMISVLPTIALGILFFSVARAVPKVEKKAIQKQDFLDLLDIWRQRNGMRIVAMICLYNMALMALLSMIPLYLAAERGFSSSSVGITFAALLVAGAVAQPWVGTLSDVIGRKPVLVLGNLIAAATTAALVLPLALWMMIAAMTVAIAAKDSIRAAMLASALDHSNHREGTTMGLAFVLIDGVGAVGAVLAGVAAGISWQHMFALAALFSLCAAALAAMTSFGQGRQSSSPNAVRAPSPSE